MRNIKTLCKPAIVICLWCLSYQGHVVAGDFPVLDFNHPALSNTPPGFQCKAGEVGFCSNQSGGGTDLHDNDGTAISQFETTIDGEQYLHFILGDPQTGFALETLTRVNDCSFSSCPNDEHFSPDAPGGGSGFNGIERNPFNFSGAGRPTRMVMRMVVSGDGMDMEFYKPLLAQKPKITQTIVDQEMSSEFIADMRGLSYDEAETAAPVTNRLAISDPELPDSGIADFDIAFQSGSHVTAGQFTFTEGTGWDTPDGPYDGGTFDAGSYSYVDGDFDVFNVDWGAFFDAGQNPQCSDSSQRYSGTCP